MSNFKNAIEPVLKAEAGYTVDTGGETWKGIARKFWPAWEGWKLIDSAKRNPAWSNAQNSRAFFSNSKILSKIAGLDSLVYEFYKTNFWDKIGGDSIEPQAACRVIIDSAVNEGVFPAIKRAQLIFEIEQTGKICPLLISKLNSL